MSAGEVWVKKAYSRLTAYCAKAERSPKQIREKLRNYPLKEAEILALLEKLKHENYINELRFAKSFAHDKLNFNKWGKIRISNELNSHGLDQNLITSALDYIDAESYFTILRNILRMKWQQTSSTEDKRLRKNKVIQYALQKGFSYDDIKSMINESIAL